MIAERSNAERGSRNAEQASEATRPSRDLRARTKAFALAVIRLVQSLRYTKSNDVLGKQLLRSGTSVAANYRAARRARSRREFIARMGIVEEEADESQLWLELLSETDAPVAARIGPLRDEAGQLVAIAVASVRTARLAGRTVPRSALRVPRSS